MECSDTPELKNSWHPAAVPQGELSQSSGVISLPSANKLADLSLASDITDSELENEATVLSSDVYNGQKNDLKINLLGENEILLDGGMKKLNTLSYCQGPFGTQAKDLFKAEVSNDDRHSEELPAIASAFSGCYNNFSNGKTPLKSSFPTLSMFEHKEIPNVANLSLDDVRVALQQNCSMLSDRHLLKDLLKSLDEKIEQESVGNFLADTPCSSSDKYSAAASVPNRDRGESVRLKASVQNDGLEFEKCAPAGSDLQPTLNPFITSSLNNDLPKSMSTHTSNHVVSTANSLGRPQAVPYNHLGFMDSHYHQKLNVDLPESSLVKPEIALNNQKSVKHESVGRHVKFQSTVDKGHDPHLQEGNVIPSPGQHCVGDLDAHTAQSNKILKQLAGLRWKLAGWEDVSDASPSDSKSSLVFLQHLLSSLQILQLQKEHLEEKLASTEGKLKHVTEESNTNRCLYEKREARLVEADKQLEQLMQDWVAVQEKGQQEFALLMTRCHLLKQENATLRDDAKDLGLELTELKTASQQQHMLKLRLQEAEELLAASRKQAEEISEENTRLNLCLEENTQSLQQFEQVKVPQLLNELEGVKSEANRLQGANEQLTQTKAHLEDDLHLLQGKHNILLKKIVEEQEGKAEAVRDKAVLEEEVSSLTGKIATVKTQLHLHYQAQVEDLVAKKSSSLQEQLKALESKLQKNLEEQLDAQRESHHIAFENVQKRHEEGVRDLKSSYERELQKVQQEVRELEWENQQLQHQRQGVISAVSSVLGLGHKVPPGSGDPSRCWSTAEPPSTIRPVALSRPPLGTAGAGSSRGTSRPTSGRSGRRVPYLGFRKSSSGDSDSTLFPEGRQTVRHLGGGSVNILSGDTFSENTGGNSKPDYQESQEGAVQVASVPHCWNSKLRGSGKYTSMPEMQNKVIEPHVNAALGWVQSTGQQQTEGANVKGNGQTLCEYHKEKQHRNFLEEDVYPSFTRKIKRASEILQASDFTDEDENDQDGGKVTSSPQEEDQEMAEILKELRMQVKLSTLGSENVIPTHDTSLDQDQDPATLTLHRLSEVSSLISQYVTQSP